MYIYVLKSHVFQVQSSLVHGWAGQFGGSSGDWRVLAACLPGVCASDVQKGPALDETSQNMSTVSQYYGTQEVCVEGLVVRGQVP